MFLDNASTTPLSPGVKAAIIDALDLYANPSSTHSLGKQVHQLVENTRKNVADFIGAESDEIIFTSGGSAGLTLGVRGYTMLHNCTLFYSPLLHKSALKCIEDCAFLPEKLKVDEYGNIDIEDFESRINPLKYKPFVVIEWASSEIGTIQDVKKICDITHKHNGKVLIDATASVGSIPIDVRQIDCDMLVYSAHKIQALKGIGVFYKKKNIKLQPLIYGTHEQGLVGGTTNTLGVISLNKAIEELDYSSINSLGRDYVLNYVMSEIPDVRLVGAPIENRLPHNLNLCFNGTIEGESLMMVLDMAGYQISVGSACNSNNLSPSTTLTAIGLSDADAHSCIRITLNGNETLQELNEFCVKLKESVEILRNFNK